MKRTGAMLVLFLVWAGTVQATPCSIHMIAGRYAGAATGNLWVGTPDFKTIAPLMPAALVGVFTIKDDGTFESTTWSGLGSQWWNMPISGTVTVNPDCTGEMQSYPLGGPAPNIEKFVILDNGRQLRGIYEALPQAPPLTMVSQYYRLSELDSPGAQCKRSRAVGTWVMTCTGFTGTPDGSMTVSSSMLARFRVARDGSVAGFAIHKLGPQSGRGDIIGTFSVNPDCTVDGTMDLNPELPMVFDYKGVLYDHAQQGFGMPITVEMPEGEFPMPARLCTMARQ